MYTCHVADTIWYPVQLVMRGRESQQTGQFTNGLRKTDQRIVWYIQFFQFDKFPELIWQLSELVIVQFQGRERFKAAERRRESWKTISAEEGKTRSWITHERNMLAKVARHTSALACWGTAVIQWSPGASLSDYHVPASIHNCCTVELGTSHVAHLKSRCPLSILSFMRVGF